jgi:hypothetical protein
MKPHNGKGWGRDGFALDTKTSFFSAYGVSCRVRAERVKPYALMSDSPQGPVRSQVGPPPPGATRELGVVAMYILSPRYTPAGSGCQSFCPLRACSYLHPLNSYNKQERRGAACALGAYETARSEIV